MTVAAPIDGGFYAWGDSLRFEVSAADAEDGSTDAGTIDCAEIVVQPGVGHDDHNHPLEQFPGCAGTVQTPPGHGTDADNVFLVLDARYTDRGAEGAGALSGLRQVVLRPQRLEAEHYARQSGVQVEATGDYAGGENIGYIDDGDWVAFEPVSLSGIDFVTFRVASAGAGGRIEARMGAVDGPLVATAEVSPTGGWQVYKDVTVPVTDPGGTHTLFLVFRNQGSTGLFNLNWLRVHGDGVALPDDTDEGLVAEYFATPDLSGDAVTRIDPQVSFDWGVGAPLDGLPLSNFSVRWRGRVKVPTAGRYQFTTVTDDGARLWVGDELLIDAWDGTGVREEAKSVVLEVGLVPIRMEYRDTGRAAEAALLWSGPDISRRTLGEDWLIADASVATDAAPAVQVTLALDAPRPNPARGTAEVAFALAAPADATVELFDALGRRMLRLHDGPAAAGPHTVTADLSSLASGVYVVRLAVDGETLTRTLTVVR